MDVKTILLTGNCGFIGSHVADRLEGQHQILGVDCLDERVHPSQTVPEYCDGNTIIADVAHVPYWVLADVEVVIHLAAQVGVADSMTDPLRYIGGNTEQTASLLNDLTLAATRGRLKRLVVASSMSVYGDGGPLVKEESPCVPTSVYGLTKYDQERLCRMWGAQHDVEVVALRFFNVFGPRQQLSNPYTGVLANFANAILDDVPPTVYEDGGQTRDFIYVADVADAVVRAATLNLPCGGVYNVCTGKPTTVLRAARCLADALGKPELEPHITGTKRHGDIRHCTGNPKAAKDGLFWEAAWTFERGIKEYGAWLLAQRSAV